MLPASLLPIGNFDRPSFVRQYLLPQHRFRIFSRKEQTFKDSVGSAVHSRGFLQAMHIRRYKCEADEGSVLAVFDRAFPFSHSFLESPELAGARQHLVLSLGQSETLIAEIEGSVIGFITVGRAGYI